MFSSPSRGTPRRRAGGAPSSIRSKTAHLGGTSTPTLGRHASRRREDSILSNDTSVQGSVREAYSDKRKEITRSDVQEGTILSRDELHAVTVYCRLPVEVTSTLQKNGQYDPCFSFLDAQTGFAYLSTPDKCFVWSFASRGLDSPPCYTFPVSTSSTSTSSIVSPILPYCSLLARGGDREPGFIILTQSGELSFCDNIALGGERMIRKSLPLGSGEAISQLHRCGTSLFLAATTFSRLFSIRFVTSGGALQAQMAPFTQSKGLFGRLFGTASQFSSTGGIVSIASSQPNDNSGAFEVYAMSQSVLQKWSVVEGGGERLLVEEDLKQLLMNQMVDAFTPDSFNLVDVALTGSGTAAVLFSYAPTSNGLLRYQVAFIESSNSLPSFTITSTKSLDYTRYPDTRPYSHPRLLLPYGGPIMFVIFPEAVILRLLQDGSFEESIEMRDISTNRIIGIGAEGPDVQGPTGLSNLSIVTAISGALLVEIDVQKAQELDMLLTSGSDKIQVLTRRLKSKIERGVFHGNELENPISFDLPQDVGGNLLVAVEQLSEEIVLSESPGLSNSVDLRVQLADRLEKLHGLASFIANSGKLHLLSQNILRKLCSDAELVAAAFDIWDYHSNFLAQTLSPEGVVDPLTAAIRATVEAMPESNWDGDLVRSFFRKHLFHLDEVLARMVGTSEQETASPQSWADLIRLNHILLSTFQAAYRYRAETATLYHLDFAHISLEAWTCKMINIKSLERQCQMTSDVLQNRSRHKNISTDDGATLEERTQESSSQQQTLRGQLCDMAKCTLDLFEERLAYLQVAGGANASLEKERRVLQEEFRTARSQIILCLVVVGRSDRAFGLAEKHKDFHVLTLLCSSLKGSAQAIRIRSYLDKYRSAFAFELYEHYIQEGSIAKLLEEEEDYHDLLSDFLQSRDDYNRIAWLHDVNLKQWSRASDRLQVEANLESKRLQDKKLMLSLRKLSYVAPLHENDIASVAEQERIELIDDQLDIINVHQKIREELKGNTAHMQQVDFDDALMASTEILSEATPAFKELYSSLAKQIVTGAVLSCEDLIDLLTLPDASEQSIDHYKTALEVYVRAKDIPSARMPESLAVLWRRIILHDDWLEVTDTTLASTSDEVLIAKLKSTAFYQTLLSASENKATSDTILSPQDCLVSFSLESLEARFRDEPREMIEPLTEDYESEWMRASEIIDLGVSRGWFDDISRLIKQEQQQDANQSQDAMDDDDSQFLTMY